MARRCEGISDRTIQQREHPIFTEVLVAEEEPRVGRDAKDSDRIHLVARKMTISLPISYPVEDLVKVILAFEARS